jgi:hypothetical protein
MRKFHAKGVFAQNADAMLLRGKLLNQLVPSSLLARPECSCKGYESALFLIDERALQV